MKVEGSHVFRADRELIWKLLNDPVILARCIPGCQKLEPIGNGAYTTILNVGLASIKGTYNATVSLHDLLPPSHFRINVEGRGPQGFVRGSGSIGLGQADGETLLKYEGDVHLGGTLASVGQRMLQGAAKMMVGQFFTAIEAEAEAWDKAEKEGGPLVAPKQGILRNFLRYLRGLLRRLFSRAAAGARSE